MPPPVPIPSLRWPTRVTTHYLTTYFELLSTHFKLCTTHSKFLKTHSKFFETHFKFTTNSEIFTTHFKIFATHFKIFATHFEIFTTHFEIFTTHSPQAPKCWQRKRNGYAAPPSSFNAMFCSTCGQQLQESFVFCPKCGLRLAASVAQGSCDVDSQKNIVETYFLAGFEYNTIVSFLERFLHGITCSPNSVGVRRTLNL